MASSLAYPPTVVYRRTEQAHCAVVTLISRHGMQFCSSLVAIALVYVQNNIYVFIYSKLLYARNITDWYTFYAWGLMQGNADFSVCQVCVQIKISIMAVS